ncbi:hypothetical protein HYT25_02050 [Candidatus Pacearchaeota archaeon]|nr:hypothetical protein [Candidatus Pacearchaeota archaeon]
MKEEIYEIYYDKEADFLEIFFGKSSKCIAGEIEKGIFVRRDIKTNDIKSIGIINFSKRLGILNKILLQLEIKIPLDIKPI